MMHSFFQMYFGFQPTLAEIIWSILLVIVPRVMMWIWKRRPPRGELLYYVIAIPCALILLSALTFATRGVGFTPDLRAHILFASLLPQNKVPSYLPHSGAIGMMIVHISNLGTPTSVDDYSVTAEADGQTFTGLPLTFNTFAGTIGKFRIGFEWSSSSLYMKTRRPIRTGDSVWRCSSLPI
jgi:hypothetical protein